MSKGFSGDVNGVLLWEPTFPWCLLDIIHMKFQVLWKEGLRIAGRLKKMYQKSTFLLWILSLSSVWKGRPTTC